MKAEDELNAVKNEVETLNKKLAELSAEELAQVSGGLLPGIPPDPGYHLDEPTPKFRVRTP